MSTPDAEPTVELDHVAVRYDEIEALAPTSLRFQAGTSTALVGANGSGKSTVLKVLAGLVRPAAGTIRRADGLEAAFVAQQHGHHRWMPLTVREVLRMGCYRRAGMLGRVRREDLDQLDEAAERLEVTELLDRSFGELSGGQRQRALVAQALIGAPRLVLFDEPITGLDLASQATILRVMAEEARDGATVVFSTHHLAEARRADRVVLLAGRVLADGPPTVALRPDLLVEAFSGRVLELDEHLLLLDDHGHGVEDDLDEPGPS